MVQRIAHWSPKRRTRVRIPAGYMIGRKPLSETRKTSSIQGSVWCISRSFFEKLPLFSKLAFFVCKIGFLSRLLLLGNSIEFLSLLFTLGYRRKQRISASLPHNFILQTSRLLPNQFCLFNPRYSRLEPEPPPRRCICGKRVGYVTIN